MDDEDRQHRMISGYLSMVVENSGEQVSCTLSEIPAAIARDVEDQSSRVVSVSTSIIDIEDRSIRRISESSSATAVDSEDSSLHVFSEDSSAGVVEFADQSPCAVSEDPSVTTVATGELPPHVICSNSFTNDEVSGICQMEPMEIKDSITLTDNDEVIYPMRRNDTVIAKYETLQESSASNLPSTTVSEDLVPSIANTRPAHTFPEKYPLFIDENLPFQCKFGDHSIFSKPPQWYRKPATASIPCNVDVPTLIAAFENFQISDAAQVRASKERTQSQWGLPVPIQKTGIDVTSFYTIRPCQAPLSGSVKVPCPHERKICIPSASQPTFGSHGFPALQKKLVNVPGQQPMSFSLKVTATRKTSSRLMPYSRLIRRQNHPSQAKKVEEKKPCLPYRKPTSRPIMRNPAMDQLLDTIVATSNTHQLRAMINTGHTAVPSPTTRSTRTHLEMPAPTMSGTLPLATQSSATLT